ncbi:phage baseplate assembly protein V [Microvirga brassicacearum]|uniref:Gp5/Type VI secretion system Vgr protein OB-fold domain-containing protein n=1 Tax=Microvirga brassicacearum TaxID=2580413 RepID=A0A5N3PH77_9HYPH|nr:phage baseplate assembly protein V [Microvirga brassicacearum]KAB0269063.1 hypothetical protein FEZ63_02850 [Microvirga brassicacearum]
MRSLIETLARQVESENRGSNSLRYGTVHEVNAETHKIRVRLGGTDEKPYLSPWIPYAQVAGALKVHTPPSKGQQFALMSGDGDFRRGIAIPMTWSDENASPSKKGDEHVMTFGDVKVEVRGKQLKLTVGGAVFDATDQAVTLSIGGTKMEWSDGGLKTRAADYDWKT